MTQEQILGNKLIASWMGFKTWVTDTGIVMAEDDLTYAGCISDFKCFQYHSDWNLLMPVVEKIEAFQPKNINEVFVSIKACECTIGTSPIKFRVTRIRPSKKEATFLAIIDFITWHNNYLSTIQTESIFNEAKEKFGSTLKNLADTEIAEMHILYNPTGQKEYHEEKKERTLDREKITRTEASNRNAVLRDSGSDNRWILDITARV